jgi:hypothetical protein
MNTHDYSDSQQNTGSNGVSSVFTLALDGQVFDVSNLANGRISTPSLYPHRQLRRMKSIHHVPLFQDDQSWSSSLRCNSQQYTEADPEPRKSTVQAQHDAMSEPGIAIQPKAGQYHNVKDLSASLGSQPSTQRSSDERTSSPFESSRMGCSDTASSLPPDGHPQLETSPGIFVPYFGAAETIHAARRNQHWSTECLACNANLTCFYGVERVVCSGCHTVSPVDYQNDNYTPRVQPHGVGIGLRQLEAPRSWQRQDAESNQHLLMRLLQEIDDHNSRLCLEDV